MTQDADGIFCQVAHELGYLSAEQVADCRQAAAAAARAGVKTSVRKVILERHLLSEEQLAALEAELRRRSARPRVGGYELLEKLGEGGMGEVFRVRQVSLDRTLALKVLSPELARTGEYIERFRREALLAAKLSHPNAVQVLDVGEDAGRHYLVMEYIDGASVAKLLAAGPLGERRSLEIIRGVAQALAAAHEMGIVHRDIKPANILLTRNGVPKVADLGIARYVGGTGQTLTRTGVAVGTPQYMSPEQCRGDRDLDGRSDIYSLGATLFHMLCGRPPFLGAATPALLIKQVYEPLPDPRTFNPQLSEGTVQLLQKMTAKEPSARFPLCRDVVAAVERVLHAGATGQAGEPVLEAQPFTPNGRIIRVSAPPTAGYPQAWPTPPSTGIPAVWPGGPSARTHSRLGVVSFIVGCASAAFCALLFVIAGVAYAADPKGPDQEAPIFMVVGLGVFGAMLANLAGLGLGIAGWLQRERKKTFAVIGTAVNGAMILGVAFLIVVGLASGSG